MGNYMSMDRPGWDEYFLGIAQAISLRADCTRRRVGVAVVKNNRIVSTGYNGAPSGDRGCMQGACPRGFYTAEELPPGSSYDTGAGACIAVHAEANALLYADRDKTEGATLYCTDEPCDGCTRLIRGAGILRVVSGS